MGKSLEKQLPEEIILINRKSAKSQSKKMNNHINIHLIQKSKLKILKILII